MTVHILLTVYSVEGIGWKPTFRVGSLPKFYLEVVVGSQPPVSSKEVEIVDDACTWEEKLPLVITSLDDTLQFRLRRHARVRTDPTFGTLDITAKELIKQSSGDDQRIHKDLQREKGKARPDVSFIIQLSARETDADGNAQIALGKAVTDMADNNVGSVGAAAAHGMEIGATPTIVGHLSTLSEKLGAMSVITDKVEFLAELHPYAQIAWTICSSLYQAVKKQHLTDLSLLSLIKTMSETYSVVDELKDLPDKIKSLETVITLLLQQIGECALFVREYVHPSFSGRVIAQLWKDQSLKVQDFMAGFEKLRLDLNAGTTRHGVFVMSRMKDNVDELLRSHHLTSLKPSPMNRATRKACLPGTRKTILDDITDQILRPIQSNNNIAKNIVWLHGMAGSGKSTIATTIAQQFDRLGRRGAYLFFERATSDPTAVIRTIAHQLALFDSTLCTEIHASILAKPTIMDESLEDQAVQLLCKPLERAARKLTGPIVIVLDALDECGDVESRQLLLKVLKKTLPTIPPVFRFLITSRPETDIKSKLEGVALELQLESRLEKEGMLSDVRVYLTSTLGDIRNERNLAKEWPRKDQIDLLVESSEGLFIWASTMCKLIYQTPVRDLEALLSGTSEQGIQGLDLLYATTLEMSHSWISASVDSWNDFRSIMAVVLFSRINLNEATVDHILGLSGDASSRFVVSSFPALLERSQDHTIRPLHASLRDYLMSDSRSRGKPWSLTCIDPERLLVEGCFRIMSNQLHFNICGIKTSYKPDYKYFASFNTAGTISQELKYSCQYWAIHLQGIHKVDDPIIALLETFSYSHFLFWAEVMWVEDLISESRNACREVAKCMKGYNSILADFWNDGYRFLMSFGWNSTPHIYLSALPLTPPTSKISQIYLPKFPNTLKVIFEQRNSYSPSDHNLSRRHLSHLGFSPDGTMLISCFGYLGAVHIRSTQDYSLPPKYHTCHHPDGIQVAKFSHDNLFLYCLTRKGALVLWETTTGQFTEIHPSGISNFDMCGEETMACCEDGSIRIWTGQGSKHKRQRVIPIGDQPLGSIAASSNGLVAVSQGKLVHIVDTTSQTILRTNLLEIYKDISALSFSDSGDSLAVSLNDTSHWAYLCSQNDDWRATSQEGGRGPGRWGSTVVWLREKSILCIGWDDGTVSLWNIDTQSIIPCPLYHSDGYCQVAISPDGKTLATGTKEDCIKIWDVEMLLGQGESGAQDPLLTLKAESPQLFDGCKYENEWIIAPGGERLLWVPFDRFEGNHTVKYTTLSETIRRLDFSKFVHGEEWTKCYSGNVEGKQQG